MKPPKILWSQVINQLWKTNGVETYIFREYVNSVFQFCPKFEFISYMVLSFKNVLQNRTLPYKNFFISA